MTDDAADTTDAADAADAAETIVFVRGGRGLAWTSNETEGDFVDFLDGRPLWLETVSSAGAGVICRSSTLSRGSGDRHRSVFDSPQSMATMKHTII